MDKAKAGPSSKPPKPAGAKAGLAAKGGVAKKAGVRKGAAGADDEPKPTDLASFKGLFQKDLRIMMYGFGDSVNPLDETVDLVEDIVLEYMKESTLKAAAVSADSLKPKVDERDFLFSVRKEPAKFGRVKELLMMQQVIKDARSSFEKDPALQEAEAEEAAAE